MVFLAVAVDIVAVEPVVPVDDAAGDDIEAVAAAVDDTAAAVDGAAAAVDGAAAAVDGAAVAVDGTGVADVVASAAAQSSVRRMRPGSAVATIAVCQSAH